MRKLRQTSCVAQAVATTGAQGYSKDVGWLRRRKHVNCCVLLCKKTYQLIDYLLQQLLIGDSSSTAAH